MEEDTTKTKSNHHWVLYLIAFLLIAIIIIILTIRYMDCINQGQPSTDTPPDTIYIQCSDHHYDSLLVETNNYLFNLGVLLQKNEAKLDIIIDKLQITFNHSSSGSSTDLSGIRRQLDSIYNVLDGMRNDSIAVTVRKIKKQ